LLISNKKSTESKPALHTWEFWENGENKVVEQSVWTKFVLKFEASNQFGYIVC
jgi:hypothetical protein